MIRNDSFQQTLKVGSLGEEIAQQQMAALGFSIEDVAMNSRYWQKDIDFLATKNNQTLKVEVKADRKMATTQNIAVETITNIAAGKAGWIWYTEATHIFFVDLVNNITHCVRTNELKDMIRRRNFRVYRDKQIENGNYYKEAELVIIPLYELQQLPHYRKLS